MSNIKVGIKHDSEKVDYSLVDMTVFGTEDHRIFYLTGSGFYRKGYDGFCAPHKYDVSANVTQARWVNGFMTRLANLAEALNPDRTRNYPENEIRAFNMFVSVMNEGAKKYEAHNWQLVRPISRFENALIRHDFAVYAQGALAPNTDDFDLPHLAHSMWNCYALAWFARAGVK